MRVSTHNFTDTMVRLMQLNLQNVTKTSNQLSTGKRLLQPADDAVDTVKILHLNDELAAIRQYESNIKSAQGELQQQDILYSSMNSLLARARDLVLQATNGTNNLENQLSFATELDSLNEELVSLANYQTADGQYLFSGTDTIQQPVTETAGDYIYSGNSLYREVQVSATAKIQISQPGDELFFDASAPAPLNSIFDSLKAAANELRSPTNLSTVMSDTLAWIDNTTEKIGEAQTRGGGDLNLLDNILESHGDMALFSRQLKSELEDVDMIAAASQLSQQQVILSASQQVYASIKQLSLFNYLS
ncbi:MAG: flagellar hook-associated protein FlgL [Endozoicomonas sp. (ex Botrylloides leachii)]|nr:flagellar hook-associated protein FlgL [Endozoicomonas sp. (ex Botrylloides leachii)]